MVKTDSIPSEMGGISHEVIALGNALVKKKQSTIQVLDLGCADGRNSFYLASLGINVTAIDFSKSSTQKLQNISIQFGLDKYLKILCSDVMKFHFEYKYDAILIHGLLHYLKKEQIITLLDKVKSATKSDGINIFTTAFYPKSQTISNKFIVEGHKNALELRALDKYYSNWTNLLYERYKKYDYHPEIGYDSHPIEKWIFIKSNKNSLLRISNIDVELDLTVDNESINKIKLIDSICDDITKILGTPNKIVRYYASGPQFSFKEFSLEGYELKFYLYNNLVIYCSNRVVSGYSFFETEFHYIEAR